jgi:hypothetical protein
MSEPQQPVELAEDGVPLDHIEKSVQELVELYGGQIVERRESAIQFSLPLRRAVASAGTISCTVSWTSDDRVKLICDRNVDAPRFQRILLLVAGVIGACMFMLWPFFPHENAYGTLAWMGGIMAIAVYLMTLRKTGGGIAYDFLQRLAMKQRSDANVEPPEISE